MYLVENGWQKFITWFDYESWYPIGRPIGKSIYPGMQVAAAVIHWFLGAVGYPLSLNDVCVHFAARTSASISLHPAAVSLYPLTSQS
jgi:dolichyl-diphosphooligosaccharide--protein glycosyltransferase